MHSATWHASAFVQHCHDFPGDACYCDPVALADTDNHVLSLRDCVLAPTSGRSVVRRLASFHCDKLERMPVLCFNWCGARRHQAIFPTFLSVTDRSARAVGYSSLTLHLARSSKTANYRHGVSCPRCLLDSAIVEAAEGVRGLITRRLDKRRDKSLYSRGAEIARHSQCACRPELRVDRRCGVVPMVDLDSTGQLRNKKNPARGRILHAAGVKPAVRPIEGSLLLSCHVR